MASGRAAVLTLYRNLIKESKNWHSYNYRNYALRKIRHEFQERKNMQNAEEIKNSLKYGYESLNMIKRQALIGNLYATDPLVIEVQNSAVTGEEPFSNHENHRTKVANGSP